MSFVNYFCSQDNGNNATGDGSVGDPWQTVQGSLDNITQASAGDCDVINVLDEGEQQLAADLDFTSYGTPSENIPLIIAGCTAAAFDGGFARLDINGNPLISASTNDVHVRNLVMRDASLTSFATDLLRGTRVSLINCEITDMITTDHLFGPLASCLMQNCYVHDVSCQSVIRGTCAVIANRLIAGPTRNPSAANIEVSGDSAVAFNIVSVAGNVDGISHDTGTAVMCNSIFSQDNSTGDGINASSVSGDEAAAILGNLVEGFSGTGGAGIRGALSANSQSGMANRVFDCATAFVANNGEVALFDFENEILTESPFANAAGGDFTPTAAMVGAFRPNKIGTF